MEVFLPLSHFTCPTRMTLKVSNKYTKHDGCISMFYLGRMISMKLTSYFADQIRCGGYVKLA